MPTAKDRPSIAGTEDDAATFSLLPSIFGHRLVLHDLALRLAKQDGSWIFSRDLAMPPLLPKCRLLLLLGTA